MGGVNHGFRSHQTYVSAGYQTPIIFKKGFRMRIALNGSHSKRGEEIGITLLSSLGRPLSSTPQAKVNNRLLYSNVSSYGGIDSIDWSLGRNIALYNDFNYHHAGWSVGIEFSLAHHLVGSDWEYVKTTLNIKRSFQFLVPVKARFFAGKIVGEAPIQEQLFLCGDLRINWLADLIFSQAGTLSPQEHIHVPGDGGMRGYQALHIKSDQMYALNLEFPDRSPIRIFTDIGYYDQFAFDVGICLAIGAETIPSLPLGGFGISVNAPLYTYCDQDWEFRWSIGFSM